MYVLSSGPHRHTMMETTMEGASKSMQDVSETASDMEMEEQKKREQTPKQMQETSAVTSNTALPEQKKICNELTATKQALVKALFQAATEAAPLETTITREATNTTSSPTTKRSPQRKRRPYSRTQCMLIVVQAWKTIQS